MKLATEYAAYYKVEPQAYGESDLAFQVRVARALRDKGMIIEAAEAERDAFYDVSEAVQADIIRTVRGALGGLL